MAGYRYGVTRLNAWVPIQLINLFFTLFRLLLDLFFSAAPNDNKKHQAYQVADNQSSQNTHPVLPYFYSFIRS